MVDVVAPYLTLIAVVLSTVSLVLSLFTLRRQGIPDRYEVQRRIHELLAQRGCADEIVSETARFRIHTITVTRESGFGSWGEFKNWLREYWTSELQGHTEVALIVNNGHFTDDFEGTMTFSSDAYGEVIVEVDGSDTFGRFKSIRFDTANAADVQNHLLWLCTNQFPVYARTHSLA